MVQIPAMLDVMAALVFAFLMGIGIAYTDSVRVIYQGRLIPSASYPQGKVFDPGTVYGKFSMETSSTTRFKVANMVDGFATALQRMHVGDYWRVYIPSELAYGSKGAGDKILPNSTLIFDVELIKVTKKN